MHRLLRGIQPEQAERRIRGRLDQPPLTLVVQQAPQDADGSLPEPLALVAEELLEGGVAHRDAEQEIAGVEPRRTLERTGRGLGSELLERDHIDLDRRGIEVDRVSRAVRTLVAVDSALDVGAITSIVPEVI